MTRQGIIDNLTPCIKTNGCYECELFMEDTSVCLNYLRNLIPEIIDELERIEKLVECLEYELSKVIVGSPNGMVYQAGVMDGMTIALNLLKGDDTNANPIKP